MACVADDFPGEQRIHNEPAEGKWGEAGCKGLLEGV